MRPMDVLVDLTSRPSGGGDGQNWLSSEWFLAGARRVTCVVAPGRSGGLPETAESRGWTLVEADSAIAGCNHAMVQAAASRAYLLALRGPVEVTGEALFVMRACLESDPMFGCAAARVRCVEGCCVRSPARSGLASSRWIPRRVLADIAEVDIRTELFEACLLLAPAIVGEFGPLDPRFEGLPGALLHYLSRARRCGYRTVMANRAVTGIPGASCRREAESAVSRADHALLQKMTPEFDRGWEEFRAASHERFEQLSAHAHRAAAGPARPSLLLDIRNVGPVHNGTSRAVLGCVEAMHRLDPDRDVTLLVQRSAATFHRIQALCLRWELTPEVPGRAFTAGVRLSQPWHIQEMVDLHRASMFNLYVMLDTISWDVVYPPPVRLDGTWSFLADHADGLLFDSLFTERRFLTRFERAAQTPHAVCRYPFDRAEYVDPNIAEAAADHILVVGNELDHKDAIQTVDLLSAAFPFRSLVSLGPQLAQRPYLQAYRSGSLSDAQVNRLYAGARLVVFPSFYEGFGFPIVTALAHGKTLVARKSDLLDEIAARCSTGRVVAFTRREDLVQILGRLLNGEPVEQTPTGTVLADVRRRWADVAEDVMAFVDRVVSRPVHSRWIERERAVNQLLAFRA